MADDVVDITDDRSSDWIVRTNKDGTTEAILDSERVSRARLRFEARRWRVSKMLPRTYGDRLDLTAKHDPHRRFHRRFPWPGRGCHCRV
jgi:terminase small subunit-like protein